MKKIFLILFTVISLCLLWGDVVNGGNKTPVDIHDRVRNCPAMTTERVGTSNLIYITTFGLSPTQNEIIEGKPAKLMKIEIENFITTWTMVNDSLSFEDLELEAYDAEDSVYINNNFSAEEAGYRLYGQTGCWASPVLDEENGVVYILNKSGMLFSVDVETLTITGGMYNLRSLEKAISDTTINEYEYMATPLLRRDAGGDYLIIPGIWNVYNVPITDGELETPERITVIGSLSTDDCYMSPAACDYEEDPNFVIVSNVRL